MNLIAASTKEIAYFLFFLKYVVKAALYLMSVISEVESILFRNVGDFFSFSSLSSTIVNPSSYLSKRPKINSISALSEGILMISFYALCMVIDFK